MTELLQILAMNPNLRLSLWSSRGQMFKDGPTLRIFELRLTTERGRLVGYSRSPNIDTALEEIVEVATVDQWVRT